MKKSLELKETRSDLVSKLEAIHTNATAEKRELKKSEAKNADLYISKIDTLDAKISRTEKIESEMRKMASVSGAKVSSVKADKRYSLTKAINESISGGLTGIEKEYDQEAKRSNTITGLGIPTFVMGEQRTNPQTTTDASELIETNVGDWAPTLQANTVLGPLATWMTGLSGDMKLPVLSGTTAGWNDEVTTAATDAATAIGGDTLSPRKLDSYMDISKMLLAQTSGSVEGIIRQDMNNAIAAALESAVLGSADGTGNAPEGVFNTGTAVTGGTAPTLAKIIEMESNVAANNADFGRMAYIASAKARGAMKAAAGDIITTSGASQPLWTRENTLNSYQALATNCIPDNLGSGTDEGGIVFGRWDDCVIGQFGSALDIVVDPYTLALTGQVRIVMLSYWDTVFRRSGSFSTTSVTI